MKTVSLQPWLCVLFIGMLLMGAYPAAAQIVPAECRFDGGNNPAQTCTICHLSVLISNLIDFLITRIAFPLGTLLIVVGGLAIMLSGPSESWLSWGKNILKTAVLGLVIVLVAWVLVDTTIKMLTGGVDHFEVSQLGPWHQIDTSFCTSGVSVSGGLGTGVLGTGETGPVGQATGCPTTCIPLTLPTNGFACQRGNVCQVDRDLAGRLQTLNQSFTQDGRINMRINEAWPPTVPHQDTCHQGGTCVDIGISSRNASDISYALQKANAANLRAEYEVQTPARRIELINQGVPANQVLHVAGINNEHFSIYMN